ncbi:MAG: tetratricopeptide repeat protein [Rhizomicrobium sp.]
MHNRFSVLFAGLLLAVSLSACANLSGTGTAAPQSFSTTYGAYLAARLAASQHDLPDAARLYRESLAGDPDNGDLLDKAFLYAAVSGNLDDAVKLARRVVMVQPDNRAARLALAVDAFHEHDYPQARVEIGKSAKGPFTALTLVLLDAWAQQGEGNTDAALADLKNVTNEGGTEALASFQNALVLDLAGRNDEADAAYRQTLEAGVSPRAVEAYGRFLERAGRAADARALYEKLAADESVAPIAAQGLARLEAGKIPDRLVATPADGAAEALFGIAASLTDQTSVDIAILYLQFTLSLSPDLDLAKIVLADRYEALEKYDTAIAVYRSIGADSPYRAASDVQIAIDDNRSNKTADGIAALVAITAARPTDISAWTALGDLYRAAENYPKAADAYDHAIKLIHPVTKENWPLYFARAVAEEQSGHWDLAEQDLKTALQLSPDQAQVLNYLGYSWVDKGVHLPEALAMLEKARALSPFDGYIVDSVGWAYYRLGRYEEAAKTLHSAVMLVPGDSTINEHLGDAYWRVGRRLDAHFQWSHALAFGPDAEEKPKLEHKLQFGLEPGGDPT